MTRSSSRVSVVRRSRSGYRRRGHSPHGQQQEQQQRSSKRHRADSSRHRESSRHGGTSRVEWPRQRLWLDAEASKLQQQQQQQQLLLLQQQQQQQDSRRTSRRSSFDRRLPPRTYQADRDRDRERERERERDRERERERYANRQKGTNNREEPSEDIEIISLTPPSPVIESRNKTRRPAARTGVALVDFAPGSVFAAAAAAATAAAAAAAVADRWKEAGGSRRFFRRGHRSRSSSWLSVTSSQSGAARHRVPAAAGGIAPAAAAASSRRSSRARKGGVYSSRSSKYNRSANGGKAAAVYAGSSRHKPERRSRRDAAGSSGKKSQQQQQQKTAAVRTQGKETTRDEITHFNWSAGMWLNERYRVIAKLGDGTFGRVLRCADVKLQTQVAIKVVRDVPRYTSAARIEADILREINRRDRRQDSGCVSLLDAFMHHQRHMCLVFECLGKSLYDVLSENKYRGFYVSDILHVAKQGLTALAFMKECKLAHTDLKPENILLQSEEMVEARPPRPSEDDTTAPFLRPLSMKVKIIDFGSATFEDDYHSSLINTRQYRAPEVILDIGWDMASDMWSLGCILMELYTGDVLFRTHEHLEHLAMMEQIIEPFPLEMLQKALKGAGKSYVTTDNRGIPRLRWPEGAASQSSIDRVKNCVPLEELVLPPHRPLAEFVRYLLQIDPRKRPDPGEALRHPIFSIEKWAN